MNNQKINLDEVVRNGYIDEKKLFRLLHPEKEKPANNSDTTPPAQSPRLLSLQTEMNRITKILKSVTSVKSGLPYLYRFLIHIMFANGLRVSEALMFATSRIIDRHRFMIKGLKGSNNRLCYSDDFDLIELKKKYKNNFIFKLIDRFLLYRIFKRYGLVLKLPGHQNKIVTHAARYYYIFNLKKSNQENEDIQVSVGHKRIKSTEHYIG